jgi:hypothetical protein
MPQQYRRVLPGFVTKPFAHILPPLERAKVTTVDVITLDSLDTRAGSIAGPCICLRLFEANIRVQCLNNTGGEPAIPGFVTKPFAHILPPLERAKVTTVDVITLDSLENVNSGDFSSLKGRENVCERFCYKAR